jgi:tetratricopeptide (TPR) repeat protein
MALELTAARATAQDMLQRAQATGDADLLSQAHLAMANTLFWLGDHGETLACLDRGGLIPGGAPDKAGGQGIDIVGLAMTFEGLAAFQLGAFGRARQAMASLVLRGAPDNPHPFHRAVALQGAAWLACLFEDMAQMAPLARELEAVSREHGFIFYQGLGQVFCACLLMAQGAHAQAELLMTEGYQQHMLCEGGLLFHSFHAWKRGELLLMAGRPAQCERLLSQAIELALARNERAYLIELFELRARAWIALGEPACAERELRSALLSAQILGSVAASIGVATRLAELLDQGGRRSESIDLLTRALRGVERDAAFPRLSRALHVLERLAQPTSMQCQLEDLVV